MRALDVNKANGHDDISIRMIKLCDKSNIPAISLTYKICTNSGFFPNIWKKFNFVPVHKKDDEQIVDYYRPVSLLPIFGKILERLFFNSLFEFLHESILLNENQSGFRPSDSCEYQLLSVVHDIYESFDSSPHHDIKRLLTECGMRNLSIK